MATKRYVKGEQVRFADSAAEIVALEFDGFRHEELPKQEEPSKSKKSDDK